jgi:hypothetical protein
MKIGYALSSEEHGPKDLVEQARRAEAAGFHALWISDHFHPWNDEQRPARRPLRVRRRLGRGAQRAHPRRRLAAGRHPPRDALTASRARVEDAIGQAVPCGPDLDKHAEGLKEFADAGVDELFVQQIGPDLDAFFETWAPEILPRFA